LQLRIVGLMPCNARVLTQAAAFAPWRRLAAQHGLAWLQANYWRRQGDHVQACLGRLRDLAQEYLLLHQAAAAKVAASAAPHPDDGSDAEEEGDGARSAAAAAVAAAATLSAGRRAAVRPAAGVPTAVASGVGRDGGAAAPDGAASPAAGYDAADAKKQRRLLLAELRSAVPRPAAALLADALLAATAALEPALAAACREAEGHCEQGPAPSPQAAGRPGEGDAVAERALAAALGHLTAIWPQLPPLLLHSAVDLLVSAAAQGTEQAPSGTHTAHALGCAASWLRRLLPPQSGGGSQAGSGASGGLLAACGGWRPDAALLRQLLAAVLSALAAAEQEAAVRRLRQAGSGTAGATAATPSPALVSLQEAAALLQSAAKSTPGAAAAAVTASSVFNLEPLAAAAKPSDGAADAASLARLAAAAERQEALLQQLQQRRATQHAPTSSVKRPGAEGQQEDVRGSACKRWRRAARWQPCALGCLPCVADPNGRLPALQAEPPLALPPAFLQEQAAGAAAAAAARKSGGQAGNTAGCSEQEALLQEERAGLAAAAAAHTAAPWPAADRFAEATAGGGLQDDVAACDQAAEQPPAVPRIPLPAACTLLL
jgi:hypothetical protein